MRLSVFDQSPVGAGRVPAEAIRDSLDLAQAAEALGYHRFWVSEHHGDAALVGSAPEILTAAVAARTQRIRVGAAGVLLPYYAPFKVAEQFRVIDAVAPGRIDLGVGRSPGGQGLEAVLDRALRPAGWSPLDHAQAVRDLIAWTGGGEPPLGLRAQPMARTAPQVWMLGGSRRGADLAAELGLPFAFNYSNGVLPDGFEAPLRHYRQAWRPGEGDAQQPYVALQVWALAADTAEEAEHLFRSRAQWRVSLSRGVREPLRSPEAALAEPLSEAEQAAVAAMRERHVVGEVGAVAERLSDLARRLSVDELVIVTWTHDPAAQRRSYALLAEALIG